MRLACWLSSALLVAACGDPDDVAADAADMRSPACQMQDSALQTALDSARTSPNVMLAVKNPACGTTVYTSGSEISATKDSLWRIGSNTKTYVSAAILALAKQGKLTLDDPLEQWVQNVPNSSDVTIRMLLNHRSGLYNYTEVDAFFVDRKRVWTPREIVDLATANAPYFAPDAGYHYSNTNYVLLGMILELAGQKKVGAVLHETAIDRAALTQTFLDGEDALAGTLATGYTGSTDVTHLNHPSGPWVAGSMVASGADMVEWVSAVYGSDTILDATQREALITNPTVIPNQSAYGLGVQIWFQARTGQGLGHTGAIDGYISRTTYYATSQTAVAVVVNDDSKNPDVIFAAVLPILFP